MSIDKVKFEIEQYVDSEIDTCKENSEYWSESDEQQSRNYALKEIIEYCQELKDNTLHK